MKKEVIFDNIEELTEDDLAVLFEDEYEELIEMDTERKEFLLSMIRK